MYFVQRNSKEFVLTRKKQAQVKWNENRLI